MKCGLIVSAGCFGFRVYTVATAGYCSTLSLRYSTPASGYYVSYHIPLYYLNPHVFLLVLQFLDRIKNRSSTHSHRVPKGLTLNPLTLIKSLRHRRRYDTQVLRQSEDVFIPIYSAQPPTGTVFNRRRGR